MKKKLHWWWNDELTGRNSYSWIVKGPDKSLSKKIELNPPMLSVIVTLLFVMLYYRLVIFPWYFVYYFICHIPLSFSKWIILPYLLDGHSNFFNNNISNFVKYIGVIFFTFPQTVLFLLLIVFNFFLILLVFSFLIICYFSILEILLDGIDPNHEVGFYLLNGYIETLGYLINKF